MRTVVIIGFADALSAPEVAWSLADHGFAVVAFTRRGRRSALCKSRLVQVFEVTPPEVNWTDTIRDLRAAIDKFKHTSEVIAVMPLDDKALWLCGETDLRSQAMVVGPGANGVDLALDKRRQIELARTAGFFVPWTKFVERKEEILQEKLVFPVILKPALAVTAGSTSLGRGSTWICADVGELMSAVDHWGEKEPMILQRFVPGVGEGVFGLATGRGVLAWSGHRRVRMMNPHGSGSSACASVSKIYPESKSAGERFLQAAGWRGLFMIEMLRDASGKSWFMEFNGRSWGSMALARRTGLEYPAWATQIALDPEASLKIPEASSGTLVCRHLGREILHLLFVFRGAKSKALEDWPSLWKTLFEVVRIGRNDRFYNWRRDDPKVFVSDCLSTVSEQLGKLKSRS